MEGRLMNNKLIYIGALTLVGILCAAGVVLKSGLLPVNADVSPSSLEMRLFPMVLHASVARQARRIRWSGALTGEDQAAGREMYTLMCAQCHGRLDGRAGVLGQSFYPPAPQLLDHPTSYTDQELFWVVKHGIRNTGMPSWGNRLSDQDIWNVVAFVRSLSDGDPAPPKSP
jgi:cytochrome c553